MKISMKWLSRWGIGILLTIFGILGALNGMTHRAQIVTAQEEEDLASEASCLVSENYIELTEENSFTLLKLLSMVNSPRSLLDNSGTFGTYFAMLVSTRQYHEEIHAGLPACAQPLNLAYIQTITATQDVLALKLAEQTHPDQPRYADRVTRATDYLNETWGTLSATSSSTELNSE